jgi:hypothetical protein
MTPPMTVHAFHFDSRRLHAAFAPRKPRSPMARIAIGLLGVGLLALLVFFSVFVGAAMLAIGLVYRLTRNIRRSGLASASRTRVVEGEYRVVGKPVLPSV